MSKFKICDVDLDDIHAVQLEILEVIDKICKKYNIKYFLSGGTLLGAIRHKGFIPWDDDIDLWMTRENYTKFYNILNTELPSDLFAMDYYRNINYPLCILKIEKKGTEYYEGVFKNIDMEQCIYIDIFPLDHIWEPAYNLQTAILIKMQAIRDYKLREIDHSHVSLLKRTIYSAIPLRFCRFITERTMKFFNVFRTKNYNQLCHRGRYWPKFTAEEIDDLIETDFCNKKYPIPRNYDSILTRCYGDYMKLPPLEKQEPTHDIVRCSLSNVTKQ